MSLKRNLASLGLSALLCLGTSVLAASSDEMVRLGKQLQKNVPEKVERAGIKGQMYTQDFGEMKIGNENYTQIKVGYFTYENGNNAIGVILTKRISGDSREGVEILAVRDGSPTKSMTGTPEKMFRGRFTLLELLELVEKAKWGKNPQPVEDLLLKESLAPSESERKLYDQVIKAILK